MGFGWKEESALEEVALEGHGAGARAGLEECRHHRCRGCSSLLVTSVCAQNDVTAVNRDGSPIFEYLNITFGRPLLIIFGARVIKELLSEGCEDVDIVALMLVTQLGPYYAA